MPPLDKLDLSLIGLREAVARQSNETLTVKLKVSPTMVRQRLHCSIRDKVFDIVAWWIRKRWITC